MNNFILRVYDFFRSKRGLLFALCLAIAALCLYWASRIRFSEDISQFLPQDKQNESIRYAYQHLGAANTLLVYFSKTDQDASQNNAVLEEAIEDFVDRLQENDIDPYVKNLLYMVDESEIIGKMEFLSQNLPYFLDEADYVRIDSLIRPENIQRQMAYNKNMLGGFYGSVMRTVMMNDPLFLSENLLKGLSGFKMNDNFKSENGFLYTKDGQEALVMIESKHPLSETANNKKLLEIVDRVAAESGYRSKVQIQAFGAAYISVNNADQIKKDSILSIAIALIFILIILIYRFRSVKIMALLPAVLLFGMVFALGATSILSKEISLIAIGISSVIIGIAANYPLHFLDHKYQGYGTRQTLSDIVEPLTIGNITTVGAFLSLLFIGSPAMKDLGLFASLLLIGTIAFVLFVLPHIVPENSRHYRQQPKRILRRLTHTAFEDNKWLVLLMFVTSIVFLFVEKAGFNANMSDINYMTEEHRALLQKMTADTEDSDKLLYVVAEGDNMEKSLEKYESIQEALHQWTQKDSSISLTSIGNYLPSKAKQRERIDCWNRYWSDKNCYPVLEKAAIDAGFKADAFCGFQTMLNKDFRVQEPEYFTPLRRGLSDNYLIEGEDRAMVLSVLHIRPELFEAQKTVAENTPAFLQEGVFVFHQESILSQIVNSLSDDFDHVLYICGLIVFFFLFLSFGRIELSILSFLPLTLSWIWILALMNLLGMQFNIVNILLATFIFGMGDDYTIFMTEGCLYENRFGKKMLGTYKSTVALSAVIMFIGIGSLILAKHPAMRQLGELVVLGMFCVVLMAYIIPPFFFKWLTEKNGRKRKNPITFKNLSLTIFSFIVFLIGSLYLTVLGFFLLSLGGKTEKHKQKYHRRLQGICRFILYRIPMNPCRMENESGEENPFQKASIIISNHQSHIDLMAILALTPKLIVFTNHWVWNFPLYGRILRYADFYPAEEFETDQSDFLEQKIREGYSIAIFPEGTRSKDCSIQRFHKGAFYLAQKLKTDITPILIHGFGYALPKEFFLLKKGALSVRILKPVPITATEDYRQVCKRTQALYRQEYARLCHDAETLDFYTDEVLCNYLYKGKSVESRVRKSLAQKQRNQKLIETIAQKDSILLLHTGLGEIALLAALVCKKTEITALMENEDDYLTAIHCPSIPSNLHYIQQIEMSYNDLLDCHGQ